MICGKGKPVCPMPAAASENPARARFRPFPIDFCENFADSTHKNSIAVSPS